MENLASEIIMIIVGTVIAGGITAVYWRIRRVDNKKEDRADELHDEFIRLQTKFENLKEEWDKKNVGLAFDSSKRAHERIDGLKKSLARLEESGKDLERQGRELERLLRDVQHEYAEILKETAR